MDSTLWRISAYILTSEKNANEFLVRSVASTFFLFNVKIINFLFLPHASMNEKFAILFGPDRTKNEIFHNGAQKKVKIQMKSRARGQKSSMINCA